MNATFSQQQISGINHYYSKIANGTFNEDDIRLILLHLREYFRTKHKRNNLSADEERLLEIGDTIAHSSRDKGILQTEICALLQKFAQKGDWGNLRFTLFDTSALVGALKATLGNSSVLISPEDLDKVFEKQEVDLILCLISMLDGCIFTVPFKNHQIQDVFGRKLPIHVRLEVSFPTSYEVRLLALIPIMDEGGMFGQCILRCEFSDKQKIDESVLCRTHSSEGCCQGIKALRINDELKLVSINSDLDSIEIYKVIKAHGYDTHPFPTNAKVTRISP